MELQIVLNGKSAHFHKDSATCAPLALVHWAFQIFIIGSNQQWKAPFCSISKLLHFVHHFSFAQDNFHNLELYNFNHQGDFSSSKGLQFLNLEFRAEFSIHRHCRHYNRWMIDKLIPIIKLINQLINKFTNK